ncbi:MAG TPA: hypothetical protein VGM41_06165 [Chitinophagaceae bacterium]|jgi:hypothetical protein
MSLIPNKKNKKDNRPNGAPGKTSAPGFPAPNKGKTNTKAATRNTKLTGGSQRGS